MSSVQLDEVLKTKCDPNQPNLFFGALTKDINGATVIDCRNPVGGNCSFPSTCIVTCNESGAAGEFCFGTAVDFSKDATCNNNISTPNNGDPATDCSTSCNWFSKLFNACGPVCSTNLGTCSAKSNQTCLQTGEVKEDIKSPNSYLYCNGANYVPIASGTKIIWNKDAQCPKEYRLQILKSITDLGGAYNYPDSLEFGCAMDVQFGVGDGKNYLGAVMVDNPSRIYLSCNRSSDSGTAGCVNVAHELAHSLMGLYNKNNGKRTLRDLDFGCTHTQNGLTFAENPVTDYGKTNCTEAFAEAVAKFVDPLTHCSMKKENPKQFEYLQTNPHNLFSQDWLERQSVLCGPTP